MSISEVRLYGDPLTRQPASVCLRRCLERLDARGVSVALCLSVVDGESEGHTFPLSDGVRDFAPRTRLTEAELRPLLRAAAAEVAATAPVLVFGDGDVLQQALLEFEQACAVQRVGDGELEATLDWLLSLPGDRDVVASLDVRLDRRELAAHLALPVADGHQLLHFGDTGPGRGTDLVLAAFRRLRADGLSCGLTVFLPERARVVPIDGVTFRSGSPSVTDLGSACAVVQPLRVLTAADRRFCVESLAAARPLILSSYSATNSVFDGRSVILPIGGRLRDGGFEPDAEMLLEQLRIVLEESHDAMAERGRRHVFAAHLTGAPAGAAGEPRGGKPVLVLEAPLFETSSSSVLTLATARALVERGVVDVRLRPIAPFADRHAEFAARYPDLVPHLSRRPVGADLWLSAGWPMRMARPDASQFAVRLDWEYGALPMALLPMVSEEADLVVVHSEYVQRNLVDAGRDTDSIVKIPHGVDATAFHEEAAPLEEIVGWKGERRVLLFVGGLIWRKGFDLVIKSLMDSFAGDDSVCLLIKPMGADSSYAKHNLGELVGRAQRCAGLPEIRVIDRRLTTREMAGLYRAADLMVHPYRGEGFGMPVLEARACGLPVVVTRGGSTDDFCWGDACLGVSSERRSVALPGAHAGEPFILEPDFADLCRALRTGLDGLPALTRAAEQHALRVRAEHTWERAAIALEEMTLRAAGRADVQDPLIPHAGPGRNIPQVARVTS